MAYCPECPYYLNHYVGKDRKSRIQCEAITMGAESVITVYRNRDAWRDQITEFCCGNYRGCPIKQAIDINYL